MTEASGKLSWEQRKFYQGNGYLYPLPAFSQEQAEEFLREFTRYTEQNQERLKNLLPRERRAIYSQTHLTLPWVYEIVSNANVLDAVEGVLGPDILVWDSGWFIKFPHDHSFISWHQDGVYWGLHPPKVTTAWIALAPSTVENGCMQVIPATHTMNFPQIDTYAENNALSRGQEIAVAVDEEKAVNLVLQPGQMSLHHIGIAHGSKTNDSDYPRIGIAIRYIAAEVIQEGVERQLALLVRGKDRYGHFEIIDPPKQGADLRAIREEADRRVLKNIMHGTKQ